MVTGLWFFRSPKTYYKRLNRARDIFYPGVTLIHTMGRWLHTEENLDRTACLRAEAAEFLRAKQLMRLHQRQLSQGGRAACGKGLGIAPGGCYAQEQSPWEGKRPDGSFDSTRTEVNVS